MLKILSKEKKSGEDGFITEAREVFVNPDKIVSVDVYRISVNERSEDDEIKVTICLTDNIMSFEGSEAREVLSKLEVMDVYNS